MEIHSNTPVESLLSDQGFKQTEIERYKSLGVDLQDLLRANIDSHHSAIRNVVLQEELYENGQHWTDWE